MGPNPMTVLIKEKNLDTVAHRRKTVKRYRETQGELRSHKPRNVLGYQKLEQSRKDPLSVGFRVSMDLPTP